MHPYLHHHEQGPTVLIGTTLIRVNGQFPFQTYEWTKFDSACMVKGLLRIPVPNEIGTIMDPTTSMVQCTVTILNNNVAIAMWSKNAWFAKKIKE